MAELKLGNDSVLAPKGIDATGEMEDEALATQQGTDFIVRITNNSATPVPNFRVFVTRIAGAVSVTPPNVLIPLLSPGETEECHFLVRNTTSSVQTNYTFSVRSTYFGSIAHAYNNFARP